MTVCVECKGEMEVNTDSAVYIAGQWCPEQDICSEYCRDECSRLSTVIDYGWVNVVAGTRYEFDDTPCAMCGCHLHGERYVGLQHLRNSVTRKTHVFAALLCVTCMEEVCS